MFLIHTHYAHQISSEQKLKTSPIKSSFIHMKEHELKNQTITNLQSKAGMIGHLRRYGSHKKVLTDVRIGSLDQCVYVSLNNSSGDTYLS